MKEKIQSLFLYFQYISITNYMYCAVARVSCYCLHSLLLTEHDLCKLFGLDTAFFVMAYTSLIVTKRRQVQTKTKTVIYKRFPSRHHE